jgi:hypothetical protein
MMDYGIRFKTFVSFLCYLEWTFLQDLVPSVVESNVFDMIVVCD